MTPAERALLLAVAKHLEDKVLGGLDRTKYACDLTKFIAAVEAEAAPDPLQSQLDGFKKVLHAAAHDPEPLTEGKSCETCSSYLAMYDKCLYPRDGECLPTHKYWQPKPTEAEGKRNKERELNARIMAILNEDDEDPADVCSCDPQDAGGKPMTTLTELAAMLDAATGPSRELDAVICEVFSLYPAGTERVMNTDGASTAWAGNAIWWEALPLTSSIDAAMALVERLLQGWEWSLWRVGETCGATLYNAPDNELEPSIALQATTAPIAILKATVAALIAEKELDHG